MRLFRVFFYLVLKRRWFHSFLFSSVCSHFYQSFNAAFVFNPKNAPSAYFQPISTSNFIHVKCIDQNIFSSFTASLPGTTTAHQLVQAIRQKCSADEVLNILNELPNPENDNEMVEMTYNPLKIDVFVQTLLNLGSKSFSHSFAAIAKFHQVFKVSCPSRHF